MFRARAKRIGWQPGLLLLFWLSACAPGVAPGGPGLDPNDGAPGLASDVLATADGYRLPARHWVPAGKPRAVILALHGFNDYSNAFDAPGEYLARQGILTVAYDQRGFGEAPHPGRWAGNERMTEDLTTAARSLRAAYPDVPLYLLGDSMGGAVVLAALAGDDPPPAEGVVLVAAAVWGRSTMPWYQQFALWFSSHTIPWAKVSGRGLDIQASDNIEMLRDLGRDPLVIKETRVEAVYGLVNLMDEALAAAPRISVPVLLLYGERDEIIPLDATLHFWDDLPPAARAHQRWAVYEDGWHMLLRDLQADVVLDDIVHWIEDAEAPLPSGADLHATDVLSENAGP